MKIFGIMTVKNEADIISHTLRAATEWCDAIYVLDNGSDDGTWELVKQLEKQSSVIVAHEQTFEPFTEAIRARLFNAYRNRAQTGDWWCRLDADEIYVESPRPFLMDAGLYEVVWAISLQYYFTDWDLTRYNTNSELYDSSIPPAVKYRYYKAEYSEPRFFRHRKGLRWDAGAWPRHLGRVYPRRILVRHYKFRSPEQIRKRLATRSEVFLRGGLAGAHWRNTNWKSVIRQSKVMELDSGDGNFKIDEKLLPCHKDPIWIAAIKRLMHGTGLWP
jgi:glycosyltransferase involved in cell wall biosynthesis